MFQKTFGRLLPFSHHLFDLLNCSRTHSLHLCKVLIPTEAKQLVQLWESKIIRFLLLFSGGSVSPRCSVGFLEMIIVASRIIYILVQLW